MNKLIKIFEKFISRFKLLTAEPVKNKYHYRIEDVIYHHSTHTYKLNIFIEFRHASLVKSVQEIVNDDEFIMGFSPVDARTIGYLACQEKILREKHGKNHSL